MAKSVKQDDMKNPKKSYYERFSEMNDQQRNDEVRQFDREFAGIPGEPLAAKEKALHQRAKRKRAIRQDNNTDSN